MNFTFNILAIDKTYLIIGCAAVVAVLALIGVIVCAVRISKSKKRAVQSVHTPETPSVAEKPAEEVKAAEPEEEVQPEEEVTQTQVEEETEKEAEEQPVQAEEPEEEFEVEEPEESVEEAAEAEEFVPEEEPEEPEDPADEEEPEVEEPVEEPAPVIPETAPEGKIFIRVRYNRSYTAKLIQSGETLKNYYDEIKNELMRYGVANRISWKHETFRSGRKLLARFAIRGKTLCLYTALNPADYEGTKYKVADVSHIAKNAAVPTLYRIKNDRRAKYAKQLIADLMAANGLAAGEELHEDYSAQYPYEELEPLIDRKLVKLLPYKEFVPDSEVGVIAVSKDHIPQELLVGNVSVTEADDMFIGENVDALVEEGTRLSDKTKKEIINIDTLGKYFESGETVTLEEIKKRIPTINKRATFLKVLARGTLDKALTVEADDYSPAAIKMIVITGGKAIKTKTRV